MFKQLVTPDKDAAFQAEETDAATATATSAGHQWHWTI